MAGSTMVVSLLLIAACWLAIIAQSNLIEVQTSLVPGSPGLINVLGLVRPRRPHVGSCNGWAAASFGPFGWDLWPLQDQRSGS
jgi:hypothetical protein